MTCGTFTTDSVPAAEADSVVAMFKANVPPPTSVTKTGNADGTFKIVATFPPCPAGTTHNAGG
jgi:hypothetical protein